MMSFPAKLFFLAAHCLLASVRGGESPSISTQNGHVMVQSPSGEVCFFAREQGSPSALTHRAFGVVPVGPTNVSLLPHVNCNTNVEQKEINTRHPATS